jgi:hypothetical protein
VPADPEIIGEIVRFMHEVGRIKQRPASWKEMFFPEAYGSNGS